MSQTSAKIDPNWGPNGRQNRAQRAPRRFHDDQEGTKRAPQGPQEAQQRPTGARTRPNRAQKQPKEGQTDAKKAPTGSSSSSSASRPPPCPTLSIFTHVFTGSAGISIRLDVPSTKDPENMRLNTGDRMRMLEWEGKSFGSPSSVVATMTTSALSQLELRASRCCSKEVDAIASRSRIK